MTMHTNAPLTPPMPTPERSASSASLPTPPSTPGKPGKVKKMVDSLKRRGSKILSRRTSSSSASGLHTGSPRSPRSPARSRSRSPSPPPAGRPAHPRARTTSLVFTSLRVGRKALKRASSARSLRSEDTAVEHSRSPTLTSVGSPTLSSSSYSIRDKLLLDVDDGTLSPRMPLATIVSAVEMEAADFAVPATAEIVLPEEEHASIAEEHEPVDDAAELVVVEPVVLDEAAPVVASPEPIPEPQSIALAPSLTREPSILAPEPELAVIAPEPQPEPTAIELAPEPVAAPTPIDAPSPEPTVTMAPVSEPTAVAPAPKFVPSWSEYDEYRDIPAFVLPALYVPRVPVRAVLAALVPPFWTLHWWLHPLVPVL